MKSFYIHILNANGCWLLYRSNIYHLNRSILFTVRKRGFQISRLTIRRIEEIVKRINFFLLSINLSILSITVSVNRQYLYYICIYRYSEISDMITICPVTEWIHYHFIVNENFSQFISEEFLFWFHGMSSF